MAVERGRDAGGDIAVVSVASGLTDVMAEAEVFPFAFFFSGATFPFDFFCDRCESSEMIVGGNCR